MKAYDPFVVSIGNFLHSELLDFLGLCAVMMLIGSMVML